MNVSDGVDTPACGLDEGCDEGDLRPVRESQMDILRILTTVTTIKRVAVLD